MNSFSCALNSNGYGIERNPLKRKGIGGIQEFLGGNCNLASLWVAE